MPGAKLCVGMELRSDPIPVESSGGIHCSSVLINGPKGGAKSNLRKLQPMFSGSRYPE